MFYYEKKVVKYIRISRCNACNGAGKRWAMTDRGFELVTCPECKGAGKIREVLSLGEEENETE